MFESLEQDELRTLSGALALAVYNLYHADREIQEMPGFAEEKRLTELMHNSSLAELDRRAVAKAEQ